MHVSATPSCTPYRSFYQRHCGKRGSRPLQSQSKSSRAGYWLPVCAADRVCRCYDLAHRQVPYEQVGRPLLAAVTWPAEVCSAWAQHPLPANKLTCAYTTSFAPQAWSWQQQLVAQARQGASDPATACDDTLLLLQHSPVYTLGALLDPSGHHAERYGRCSASRQLSSWARGI